MMFCLKRICKLFYRFSIEPRQYLSLVRHKPGCTSTEDSQSRLALSDLESKGIAKTDALISYSWCVPLFLHMQKVDFFYDAAQMKNTVCLI